VADPELWTTSQVLDYLRIGRTKLWSLVREGAFPAYRIGDGPSAPLRYRRTDIVGWLERRRVNGSEPGPSAAAPGSDRGR
jgi:hypothetical protein